MSFYLIAVSCHRHSTDLRAMNVEGWLHQAALRWPLSVTAVDWTQVELTYISPKGQGNYPHARTLLLTPL